MSIKREQLSPTSVKLIITAEPEFLVEIKNSVLKRLSKQTKIPGFRSGKAPLSLVEKHLDSSELQTEFLEDAINRLYIDSLKNENIRPIEQPKIAIQKFVPFSTLEFNAEVEIVGMVSLADYKKIRLPRKSLKITEEDVKNVLNNLQVKMAEKIEVKRPAQNGDQVTIDFTGKDTLNDQPVKGADGKDFPIIIGSNSFIPGFESNLVGLKAGQKKQFNIKFPKDYGIVSLQNRQVTFDVIVSNVQQLKLPKIDDSFATKVGPFKSVEALKMDIQKQLLIEKQSEAEREYENELLEMIADGTKVAIPKVLIDEEIRRNEQEIRQNLTYRGQTWAEYLKELGKSEEEYRILLRDPAERRVKIGLILTDVADQEQITVTPEELEVRLQLLKGQYKDPTMQVEFDKPENKQSILSRILSEKTIARLCEYAAAP